MHFKTDVLILINTYDCDDIALIKMRYDEPTPPPQSFIDKQHESL
jgi:hypothetical protein